jgi:hypothetical protein
MFVFQVVCFACFFLHDQTLPCLEDFFFCGLQSFMGVAEFDFKEMTIG